MEEENGQERDEATQSDSKKVPCIEEQKNEEKVEGQIKADSSSPAAVPPDPSEPKNNMETGEQSKQREQQRGRDKDLAPSSGRKRSLSPNRDEERRERSSRRRENDTQQESKRSKPGTREEERRKSTSVPKINLPSLLSQEVEKREQQQYRGGHSSRKTSCTYKEKEGSVGEVSSLPYHGASKTQRDNDRIRRATYHPSISQREARSHHSPPPLFHFDSFGGLPRGGPDWPPTQRKSRNEKGERRSDGGQSASKERRSRRDEEERQRPGRSGDARSSESSRGRRHKRETSHNCRSGQTRETQM